MKMSPSVPASERGQSASRGAWESARVAPVNMLKPHRNLLARVGAGRLIAAGGIWGTSGGRTAAAGVG